MRKKGNLFFLVKSLTKPEKRYFKIYAKVHGGNKNYLKLFDFIDKQETHDDQAIRAYFNGQAFIRQLHVAKDYLNKLILKSLRNYHNKLTKDFEIKDLVKDIEILFHKELFDQCELTINKAKSLAKEYEKFPALIDIYGWERRVYLTRYGAEKSKPKINALVVEMEEVIGKLGNINRYWEFAINIFEIAEGGNWEKVAKHELLKTDQYADSFQAKVLFHHSTYAFSVFDPNGLERAFKGMSDLIELLEAHPKRISDDPTSYITTLTNQIGMYLHVKEMDRIPEVLSKIREVPERYGISRNASVTVRSFLKTYNVEMEMYRDQGRLEEGLSAIPEIASYLETHQNSIPEEYFLLFYYQFAHLHFQNGDYSGSLQWINRILNKNYGTVREDIQSYTRFLNLIIHFELKNIFVLKYAVESCRRFLKKKGNLMDFEKRLLKFFSKISVAAPDKHLQIFEKLRSQIFEGISERDRAFTLDYFNFEKWIEDKIADLRRPSRRSA